MESGIWLTPGQAWKIDDSSWETIILLSAFTFKC